MTTQICQWCRAKKPLSEFHLNISRKSKYATYCKPCTSVYMKNRRRLIKSNQWFPMRQHRNVPEAQNAPSTRDLEWAAGFLEGEGTFRYASGSSTAHVAAAQVNPEPLRRLQSFFGGTLRQTGYLHKRSTHFRDPWIWQVSGARARGVMLTIYVLLSRVRRLQIRNAITQTPNTNTNKGPHRRASPADWLGRSS